MAYCESLVAGRSLEALVCALWDQKLESNSFERVIYGDNAAAISLAHRTGASSWRTRHLRVRTSLLREALTEESAYPGGPWKLIHLCGSELVADGTTKPLCGAAFELFVKELGLKVGSPQVKHVPAPVSGGDNRNIAIKSMLVGSLLLSAAEAHEKDETGTNDLGMLWIGGVTLMALGAVYIGQLLHSSSQCCLRRLRALSDSFLATSTGEAGDRSWSFDFRVGASVRNHKGKGEGEKDWEVVSEVSDETVTGTQPTSLTSLPQSGFATDLLSSDASSLRPLRQSGSLRGAGSSSDPAGSETTSLRMRVRSGLAAERGDALADSSGGLAAERGGDAASSAGGAVSAAAERPDPAVLEPEAQIPNPWNRFQSQHKGKGWNMTRMRAEYFKQKRMP